MIGSFTLASFHAAPDGSGGTLITDPPASQKTIGGQLPSGAPPSSPPSLDRVASLFAQSISASFPDEHGTPITNALSQTVTNHEQFLAQPPMLSHHPVWPAPFRLLLDLARLLHHHHRHRGGVAGAGGA
jgi:hypothetical protein